MRPSELGQALRRCQHVPVVTTMRERSLEATMTSLSLDSMEVTEHTATRKILHLQVSKLHMEICDPSNSN